METIEEQLQKIVLQDRVNTINRLSSALFREWYKPITVEEYIIHEAERHEKQVAYLNSPEYTYTQHIKREYERLFPYANDPKG